MKKVLFLPILLILLFAQFTPVFAASPSPRIVGGVAANQKQTNWFAQVFTIFPWLGPFKTSSICGGSAISQQWVLTAAHCVTDEGTGQVTTLVKQGYVLLNPNSRKVNLPVTVDKIVRHPKYNPVTQANDIALIHTATLLYATTLPYSTQITDQNTNYMFFGYGNVNNAGAPSTFLKQTQMVDTHGVGGWCYTFDNTYPKGSNICAQSTITSATCNGDSGSPLVLQNPLRLVGVDSLGSCELGSISVLTRVSYFATWIAATSGIKPDTSSFAQAPPKPPIVYSLSCKKKCNKLVKNTKIVATLKNVTSKPVRWKLDNFDVNASKETGVLNKKSLTQIVLKISVKDSACTPVVLYANNVAVNGFLLGLNKTVC